MLAHLKSAAWVDLKACRAGCGWHGWSSSTSPSPASPTRSPIAWMRVSFDDFLSPHQKSIFSTQDAKRLYSNLLANYDRLIRPVANRLDLNNFQQSVIPSVPPEPKLMMWCYKVCYKVKMCIHVVALTWWNYDLSFLQLWQTDRSHAIEAQPGKFLLFGFAFVSSNKQEIKKDCFLFFFNFVDSSGFRWSVWTWGGRSWPPMSGLSRS